MGGSLRAGSNHLQYTALGRKGLGIQSVMKWDLTH
ncbi:Replication factor C large subunit [Bienertia sinuspersici]